MRDRQIISNLIKKGRKEEAWKKIKSHLFYSPADTWYLTEAARLSRQEGLYQKAYRYYQRILAVAPADVATLNGLGIAYYEDGRFEQAEACYRQALEHHPGYAACHNNYAVLLHKQYRYTEALTRYRMALEARPDYPEARYGMSTVLAHTGQLSEAETLLQHQLQIMPDDYRCRNTLGMIQLQQGNFEQGWRHYRARYHPKNPQRFYTLSSYPQPYWQGENLHGKTLLVKSEQGFGDEIQFCRFLSHLKKEKNAGRVIMTGRRALAALVSELPGLDEYICREERKPLPDFDCWTMLLDLPGTLRIGQDSFGSDVPYLFSSPEHQSKWPVNRASLTVGLVWKGAPGHMNDRNRSLSHLSDLASLLKLPGISWVSLQKGAGEDEVTAWPDIQAPAPRFEDYQDTAAVIAQLDLVISVDTSVVHLAGAMGKPCWVLLPSFSRDWRWLQGQTVSPWYPQMRLFPRGQDESWEAVIKRVTEALQCVMATGSLYGAVTKNGEVLAVMT